MNFLKQYQQLVKKAPKLFVHSFKGENIDYTNYLYRSNNVFFGFEGAYLQDCGYVFDSRKCTDCFDLTSCLQCELCYESTECFDCYNSGFCQDCSQSSNLLFCYQCRHCSNLFGCTGLTHKKFCIFNKQLSEQEFHDRKKALLKKPAKFHLQRLEKLAQKLPKPVNRNTKSENCNFANWVYYSNNLYWSFNCRSSCDCLYSVDVEFSRDCVDCFGGHEIELCYECRDLGHSFNCSFINGSDYLHNCHFCTNCQHGENLFGCVNLNNAKYYILNKQYSEKDYFNKVKKIRKELGWPEMPQTQMKPTKRGWWRKEAKK